MGVDGRCGVFVGGDVRTLQKLNPAEMVLNLTGFLEAEALGFVAELWKLILSAMESPLGIPAVFLEAQQKQIAVAKVSAVHCLQRVAC
jgi:hypothetical protein